MPPARLTIATPRFARFTPRHAVILTAAWAVPAACMILQMYATALLNGTALPPARALIPAAAEWLVWVPVTPIAIRVAQRFPIHWPPSGRPLAVHAASIVAVSLVRGAVYAGATILVGRAAAGFPFPLLWWRIAVAWLPIAAVVWGAIVAAATALAYAKRVQEGEARDAALREQLARAELGALRARLHPHFLFNALHSVSALVREGDKGTAVRVVAELSDLLRDAISRDAPEMVRLRDELAFVRRYLDIEVIRFADRLHVEWDVAQETASAVVPSLVVQPLVENAMRHAVSASWAAGRLRISARRDGDVLAIDVADDGPGITREASDTSGGVGISDTRTRLARLYGKDGSLTVQRGELGGATASLRMPYRATFAAT